MTDSNDPFDLPPRVADAFRAAYAHRAEIPASLDAAVLHAARERFDRRRLRLTLRWGTGLAAGLAAVIVLAVSLHHPAPAKHLAKGDVNADGQLNIVDALALAKHLAAHDNVDKAWDVNGDGAIDQKDVDAIAIASVSLKPAGLAHRSLPKFDDLGIAHVRSHVGSALADVSSPPRPKTFAKANPTNSMTEERQ